MGFKWPETITERPIFTHVDGKTVHFSDGTTAEVDAIMFCTGKIYLRAYLHILHFRIIVLQISLIHSN